MITPAAGIRKGRAFEVAVDYDGHPNPIIDPDKSKDGWIPTDDGAFVVNEPQGSPSWYPANDTPKDKATYDFAITVPEGRTAIANGLLVGTTDNGDDHDVALARERSDRALPGHRHQRHLRDRLRDAAERAAGVQRGRPADARRRDQGPEPAARLAAARAQRAGGRSLLGAVRAIPVRERRRRRGLGAERLLLARVADAADVLAGPDRGHGGARDRAHVVRRLGLAGGLARHLAERGLRDLVRVDLVRAHGRPERSGRPSISCTRRRRTPTPARTSGSPRRPRCRVRRRCSTRPSTTAAR